MADLFSTNRDITIKKFERDRLTAQAQLLSREIRIEELKEEIARLETDIEAQKKVIEKADFNIKQQQEEKAKDLANKKDNKDK